MGRLSGYSRAYRIAFDVDFEKLREINEVLRYYARTTHGRRFQGTNQADKS